MNDIMIDIETLAKNNNALIFAIGYAFFDNKDIGEKGTIKLSIPEGKERQFVIDPETAVWWKSQEKRAILLELINEPLSIFNGLSKILPLLVKAKRHWAWGCDFDYVHLENYFQKFNFKHSRFILRDARTIVRLARIKPVQNEKPHDPLSDCIRQIKELQLALIKFNIRLEELDT